MSIQAILHFEDKKINALEVEFSFNQGTDYTGRPSTKPRLMGLYVVIEATKDIDLWEWMINDNLAKQIKIQYIPLMLGGKSRIIEFMDAHCVRYKEHFNSTNTTAVTIALTITAAGVKDQSTGTMFEEHWLRTRPENIPVTVREEKEPEF